MTNCAEVFSLVYRIRISAGMERAPLLEERYGLDLGTSLSEDDLRNQRECFEKLFSKECQCVVARAYGDMSRGMVGKPFHEVTSELCALAFIQDIVATAMWKYDLDPGATLEVFAKDFDRLDVESERRRLYSFATGGFAGD